MPLLAAIAATLGALLLFFRRDIPADYDVTQLRKPADAIRDAATFRAGWVVLAMLLVLGAFLVWPRRPPLGAAPEEDLEGIPAAEQAADNREASTVDDAADALVQASYARVMATPLLGGLATKTDPVGIANTFDEADTALAAGQLLFDIEHRCARTSIA